MCLIIYSESGIRVSEEYYKNGFKRNGHGIGALWIENGEINLFKTLDYDVFLSQIKTVPFESPLLIHFRNTSCGKNDLTNCHPFKINDDLFFVHNGRFEKFIDHKSDFSDTYRYTEEVLKPILNQFPEAINQKWFADMIKRDGGASKLVFFSSKGIVLHINKNLGIEENEGKVWLSNDSYKTQLTLPAPRIFPQDSNFALFDFFLASTGENLSEQRIKELIRFHGKKRKKLIKIGIIRKEIKKTAKAA